MTIVFNYNTLWFYTFDLKILTTFLISIHTAVYTVLYQYYSYIFKSYSWPVSRL